jgi:hypothetical protein
MVGQNQGEQLIVTQLLYFQKTLMSSFFLNLLLGNLIEKR